MKTLAHELAHALLHEGCDNRALAELEAESTAFVVCQALGIDSGDYSFGYVATWAGDCDQAVTRIRTSGGRIQQSAAVILRALEPTAELRPPRSLLGQEHFAGPVMNNATSALERRC